MQENFMRTYRIRCGQKNKKGFEIGDGNNPLHISFSIEKCNVESPNNAKVQIWNLRNENIDILETKKCRMELRAGYGDTRALLIVGTIASVTTTNDNADRMTEIEVVDGLVALQDTIIQISLSGKVNAKKLYTMVANAMGMSVVFATDLTFPAFRHGFKFVGKAKTALQKIAQACKHKWTIQNDVLQITHKGRQLKGGKGYLLTFETGLISTPKRISIGSGKEEKTGWEVEYFLNGAIGVNDVIQLKSSTANGYYLVYKVTIDGDNMEGDWKCTAQLFRIKENQSFKNKK